MTENYHGRLPPIGFKTSVLPLTLRIHISVVSAAAKITSSDCFASTLPRSGALQLSPMSNR